MKPYEIKLDFVKLAKNFAGRWVALNPDTYEVVSSGASAQEVLDKAAQVGISEPLIADVVRDYGAYVPCVAP